jgi:hypothetical protein
LLFSEDDLSNGESFRVMLPGIGTTRLKGRSDVKRIGPIAAKLVSNPIELVAAANQKRSTEFGSGPVVDREDATTEPPIASTAGGQTGGNLSEVAGQDGDPTQPVARDVRQTIEPFGAASIASLPIMSRSMATAFNAVPRRKRFAPSAVVIDLSMWRGDHSHRANSP